MRQNGINSKYVRIMVAGAQNTAWLLNVYSPPPSRSSRRLTAPAKENHALVLLPGRQGAVAHGAQSEATIVSFVPLVADAPLTQNGPERRGVASDGPNKRDYQVPNIQQVSSITVCKQAAVVVIMRFKYDVKT